MPARGPGQPIALVDCLRALRGCDWSGAVRVHHERGHGSVWVVRGEVVHAEYRELSGEAAYWQMAALSGVAIWIEEGPLPDRRSIAKQLPPPVPRSWKRAMRHIPLEELKALEKPIHAVDAGRAPGADRDPDADRAPQPWPRSASLPRTPAAQPGVHPLPLRLEPPDPDPDLDAEPLFPRLHRAPDPQPAPPQIHFRSPPTSHQTPIPRSTWIAGAIGALILLVGGYWLIGGEEPAPVADTPPGAAAPVEEEQGTARAGPAALESPSEPAREAAREAAPVAALPAVSSGSATAERAEPAQAPVAPEPTPPAPATRSAAPPTEEPVAPGAPAETETPARPRPNPPAELAAAPTAPAPRPTASPAPPERPADPDLLARAVEVGALTGEDDARPVLLRGPAPDAPEGTTLAPDIALRLLIDERGRVASATLRSPRPGFESFEQQALATAGRYRFEPARRGGEPVPVWINHSIRFR